MACKHPSKNMSLVDFFGPMRSILFLHNKTLKKTNCFGYLFPYQLRKTSHPIIDWFAQHLLSVCPVSLALVKTQEYREILHLSSRQTTMTQSHPLGSEIRLIYKHQSLFLWSYGLTPLACPLWWLQRPNSDCEGCVHCHISTSLF